MGTFKFIIIFAFLGLLGFKTLLIEDGIIDSPVAEFVINGFTPITCDLTEPYKEIDECFDLDCTIAGVDSVDDIARCIRSFFKVFIDFFLLILSILVNIILIVALLFILVIEPIPNMPLIMNIILIYPFTIYTMMIVINLFKPVGGGE